MNHSAESPPADTAGLHAKLSRLRGNLTSVIRGKDEVVDQILIALVASGSVLLEDVPGVGKTTLAKALAASLELTYRRVQCTPDLLPADIFGFSVLDPRKGEFHFRPGPIFCNLLLVDEINRASPRTQSALLEAMAEGQVTTEGTSRQLQRPFLVIATQNPLGFQGTFALPESQLDRFLFQLSLEYPARDTEVKILFAQAVTHPLDQIKPVMLQEELLDCQRQVRSVRVEQTLAEYMVEIAAATRQDNRLRLGVSPRGSLMLFRAAQGAAFVAGRDYVLPDDVQRVAPLVLAHRLTARQESPTRSADQRAIVLDLLDTVRVPT